MFLWEKNLGVRKGNEVYIPLRVHSVYSRGKGSLTLNELSSWACRWKIPSAALTDKENLYGWAGWQRTAVARGLKPLFGCEISLEEKNFLFLVKSREGYWNLMQILNRKKIGDITGLIVIFLPRAKNRDFPEDLLALPREDFYLGGDFFNLSKVMNWGSMYRLSAVWANPLKFIENPERLILLYSIQKKIPFPPEWEKFKDRVNLYGPEQEKAALKKYGPEILALFRKTVEVAEKCEFVFEKVIPPLPEDLFPVSLREVVREKLKVIKKLSWRERQRTRQELEIVEKSGFAPYFLVVHDVIQFARKKDILYNLKGSGASSYLAYLLGISRINPIEFDLYFARFLNRGRDDPPDFDLDFDSRKRDEILTYMLEKYSQGKTGAAFVCSLKNYRARSALYDTARAYGIPPEEARSLSKKAAFFAQPDSLKKSIPPPGCGEVWEMASDLTSVYCENSLHVGGIILTPAPADQYLPLEKSVKGYLMSHFDRDAVEDLKLIKLDLLSVRGLAAISATKKVLTIKDIPPDDSKAYALFKKVKTIGCFQVESPAMMNLLRRMKPADIHDLTQALALIRPGPTGSGMKEALLRRREGKKIIRDPFLTKILPETGGLLLYEEQVMQVAERVAGMPPEEGDLLRRSLKNGKDDRRLKTRFFQEAGERGYAEGEVKKLWRVMKEFSSYSFNKAHSASYAHVAYEAVYLKAHYPAVYLTAVLNAGGGYYGLGEYVEEAKRLGIKILRPNINRSDFQFKTEEDNIRIGLMSIKGLGLKTAAKVIEERKYGDYLSLEDLLSRVSLSKAELFVLIKAGVFDSLEPKRTRQILHYFQGLEGMEKVADFDSRQKQAMLIDSLGFVPEGDSLSLINGKRPPLRIKDLKNHIGQEVEIVVRVVDARRKEVRNGWKYFFLFEDETGLLEGVGNKKGFTFGNPPACYLRAMVRSDGNCRPKLTDCVFHKLF